MKRSGFTMIELIFVIVILGILAAVAIPKLTATRTDAQVAKMRANVATLVSDVGSRWTATGSWPSTWGDVTNVELVLTNGTTSAKDSNMTVTTYIVDGTTKCLSFAASTDGNLTVVDLNATTSTVCTNAATAAADLVKTHSFGGTGVQ